MALDMETVRGLAQRAVEACTAHYGNFFMEMDQGFKEAEAFHRDLTGRELSYHFTDADGAARLAGAQALGAASAAARYPDQRTARGQAVRDQLATEDEIGRLVAEDPPLYVRRTLGRPPRPTETPAEHLRDVRWWVETHGLQEALTPRQYWERAAGAYVALVEGRCGGNPLAVRDLRSAAAHQQDTLEGQIATAHFEDTAKATTMLSAERAL